MIFRLQALAAERGCGLHEQDVAGRVAAGADRCALQLQRSRYRPHQAQVGFPPTF